MLYQCYDRLQKAHIDRPFATISEQIEMEDNPDDPRWEEYKEKSKDAQQNVDRELEFACYLVISKQVDLDMFFYLFRGWFAGRDMFWKGKHGNSRAKTYPYTVEVIMLCRKKKLLPIKSNKRLQKLQRRVNKFLDADERVYRG